MFISKGVVIEKYKFWIPKVVSISHSFQELLVREYATEGAASVDN